MALPGAISRYGAAAAIGVGVASVIFIMMYLIVTTGERAIIEKAASYKQETDDLTRRQQRLSQAQLPPRPTEPETPPEAMAIPRIKTAKPPRVGSLDMGNVERGLKAPPVAARPGLDDAVEGDYLPIVRVRPNYPRRALQQGTEGYVVVELTVTPSGTTEGARVIASEPGNIFDQAALAAARQFRYKPKVLNGVAVPVSGVRYKFSFEIADKRERE